MGLTPKIILNLRSWLLDLGIVTYRRTGTWIFGQICVLLILSLLTDFTIEWTASLGSRESHCFY